MTDGFENRDGARISHIGHRSISCHLEIAEKCSVTTAWRQLIEIGTHHRARRGEVAGRGAFWITLKISIKSWTIRARSKQSIVVTLLSELGIIRIIST